MGAGVWQLDSHLATLRTSHLTGILDVERPRLGLRQLKSGADVYRGTHLLGVQWGDDAADELRALSDCYVRGSDLIATYAEAPERPYAPQVYWRAIGRASGGHGPPVLSASEIPLELLVSVQTPLLDAQPEMTATSRVPAVEVLHLLESERGRFSPLDLDESLTSIDAHNSTGCLLLRLADGRRSYVEMVHPLDFVQGRLNVSLAGDGVLLSHTLIDCRMEKGVIIRARLRGCFLDRQDDMNAAVRLFEDFAGSALPLSA